MAAHGSLRKFDDRLNTGKHIARGRQTLEKCALPTIGKMPIQESHQNDTERDWPEHIRPRRPICGETLEICTLYPEAGRRRAAAGVKTGLQ